MRKRRMRIAALLLSVVTAVTSFTIPSKPVTVEAAVSQSDATKTATSSGVIYADSRTDFRDESIYFVMTTRFYDGDSSNNVQCWDGTQYNDENDPEWRGDFKGLAEKLDYIKALGFTAIWITPVVENCSGYDYHGYHALNFSVVDPRYESEDFTYQDFIDAAHEKGLKVIQDVVFNHTGNFGESNLLPMFEKEGDLNYADCLTQVENSGLPSNYDDLTPDAQYQARLALMKNTDGVDHDVNDIYHHEQNLTWEGYTCQTGQIAGDCVDLNTENPLVYKYIQDAYSQYIKMGVDGFRVDTTKHISRLTYNNALIEPFYEAAKASGNDSFYMFGEVCTRDRSVWNKGIAALSAPFYTWKESKNYAWSDTDTAVNEASTEQAYNDNSSTENQPTSDNAFLSGNTYHTPDYSKNSGLGVIDFPMHWNFGNASDAFRVAVGGDQWYNDATWNVTYVDSHDYAPDQAPENQRFAGSQETWAENLSLMFTFRGIPCIYYGSEIEFQKGKVIDVGPNDALSNTGRAYYGDNIEGDVAVGDFGEYYGATGTMEETLNYPLALHIQRLNKIRQAVPALRKGQYSVSDISGNEMAYKRRYTDSTTDSFALITVSGTATFSNIPNGTYVDCITGDTQTVTNGTLTATCSGKGNLRVYVLNTDKTPAPGKVGFDGKYLYGNSPVENVEQQHIYFKNTAGWDSVTANLFSNGTLVESLPMSQIKNQDYGCTYAGTAGNLQVVFTNGSSTSTAASFQDGGYYDTNGYIQQYVIGGDVVQVSSVTLSDSKLDLEVGETATVTATVLPEDAKNKSLSWTSSDTNVATVRNGIITPQGAGTATITASSNNGIKAQVTVTVTVPPYDYEPVEDGQTAIYFEKPSGWGNSINCYLYYGGSTTIAGTWPGSSMTKLPNGVYRYVFDTPSNAGTIKVLFNDGSNQAPSDVGFDVTSYGKYNSSGLSEVIVPVNGPIAVTGVSLNQTTATLTQKGETLSLTATVKPTNATNKNVTWTSSNSSVATVDSNGIVTAVANGTATITVTTEDCSYTATCKVTVNTGSSTTSVTGVTLNKSSATLTSAGATTTLAATIAPSNATNKNVSWSSSNTSVAKVSSSGVVTAVANGTATITAATEDGNYTAACKVTVNISSNTISVIGVALNKSSATLTSAGATTTLTATILPDNATNKNVTWSSSNTSVAKVSSSGVVTAVANGTATITVTTEDGNTKATCKITVDIPVNPLEVSLAVDKVSPQTQGTTVKFTAAATGGTRTLQYRFRRVINGKETVFRDYMERNWANANPGTPGSYTIYVDVKDEGGNVVTEKMEYTWKEEASAPVINSFDASAASPQIKGTTVKFTVDAEGEGTLQYRFYRMIDGKTTVFRDYSTKNYANANPGTPGSYTIYVDVKDENGNVVTDKMEYTWKEEASAPVINSFDASAASPQTKGTTVKFTVDAEGEGTLQYRFRRVINGKETVFRDYMERNWANANPGTPGSYTIYVDVKDENGNVVTDKMEYTWKEEASAPEINSFNASVASPQIKGTTVKFTIDAEGEGTLQYRFYRMIDGKTTVFRDYSTKNYANANPGTPGSYTIYVDVKDENGNVVTEKMEYTWEKEPTELKINSINVSIASPQTKGTTVKLTVDAEGGEGTLQYRFFRTMNGTTTVFRSFSTSNTANCNPPQAGTYTILVDVMDETGNTVTKSITYQWK